MTLRKRSIGFRLAAWYFLVFAIGVSAFSIAAWFGMRASLFQAIDEELQDRVKGVRNFMEHQIAALSVPEIRDEFREHSVLGPGGDLFQVSDADNQWLYRSVALENNNVPIDSAAELSHPRFEVRTIQDHPLRFYSERVVVNGNKYTVQVAAPLHETIEALEAFRVMLLFLAPLLLIGASAGGYWISRRALQPVDDISQAANRISIENLKNRLQVPETGDQLQRVSETLNAMLARLDASVERMKQFTADASHELRAPVSLIRTTAEVAMLRDRPPEEYREALSQILEESERTSKLVDSLMMLARADSGKEDLERVEADANAILQEAAEQGERLARNRSLDFRVSVPNESLPVVADSEALRRALLILIDNAVKYTPDGGRVEVSLDRKDGHALIAVADTGIGMAEQDIPHIFDRFWRADKARSRAQAGVGLGLPIARWIVAMHRGEISVTSAPGKGSRFEVTIPLAKEVSLEGQNSQPILRNGA